MAEYKCFLCKASLGRFSSSAKLDNKSPELMVCQDCFNVINTIKSCKSSEDAYYRRCFDKAKEDLYALVKKNSLGLEAQSRIDEAIRFPLLSEMRMALQNEAAQEAEEKKAFTSMLITSGFNFEGYRIVKYSGYISGDDVVQVDRGLDFLISRGTDTGSALSDALVKIRRNALRELKKAAYDLGCNAVIGVDFDYITLDPQTANIMGGTTYMPYVFCVTANGNAVVIEKIED